MNHELQNSSGFTAPLIVVNFKTYLEGAGLNALSLAKIIEEVSNETGITIVPVVQLVDLKMVSDAVSVPVFVQHVDGVGPGSNTGKVLAEAVKEAGAAGTLLNHSENRISVDEIKASLDACERTGLFTILCAENSQEGVELNELGPSYVAIEPPELIGGDVSVTSANPGLISESVEKIGNGKVLVGAGVKTGEDVRVAKELGSVGVLVASGVCKSDDPKSVLMDFAKNLL